MYFRVSIVVGLLCISLAVFAFRNEKQIGHANDKGHAEGYKAKGTFSYCIVLSRARVGAPLSSMPSNITITSAFTQ